MNNLGWLYQAGLGVARDLPKARQWYEKAFAAGNVKAIGNLADMLEDANSGPTDFPRAAKLLLQGAREGDELIIENLQGDMKKWNARTRIELKRELSRLGHFKGLIDDRWDDKTRAAIGNYVAAGK